MLRRLSLRRCAGFAASEASPLSDAMRLKQHCTITLTKYRDAPAEVYLNRGIAYMQLGQPYFALADFVMAAERQTLPPTYKQEALDAVAALPENIVATYPASNRHLDMLVTSFLGPKFAVDEAVPGCGRGIVAKADAPAGAVVVAASAPYAVVTLKPDQCACCAQRIVRTFHCEHDDCHEEYCSRECRSHAMAHYHAKVCRNKEFQSLELELYAKLIAATDASEKALCALHLLLMRVMALAVHESSVPSAMRELRTLTGRATVAPKQLIGDTMDFYKRLTVITSTIASVNLEEIVGCLARLTANCINDGDRVALHVPRSMLNHACRPNVALGPGGAIVATAHIAKGEQACISYYPHLGKLPYAQRRAELLRRNFDCNCATCASKQ
jgi:hypothetical protein